MDPIILLFIRIMTNVYGQKYPSEKPLLNPVALPKGLKFPSIYITKHILHNCHDQNFITIFPIKIFSLYNFSICTFLWLYPRFELVLHFVLLFVVRLFCSDCSFFSQGTPSFFCSFILHCSLFIDLCSCVEWSIRRI